jgi:hypothetical protein
MIEFVKAVEPVCDHKSFSAGTALDASVKRNFRFSSNTTLTGRSRWLT